MQGFRVVFNSEKGRPTPLMRRFDRRAAAEAAAFHRGFGEYAPTPLTELTDTAAVFGIGNILVKDESFRFGLNAFKVLGGSYCLGKLLSTRLGSEALLDATELRRRAAGLPPQTFVTATDGNHGRGIAWAASYFGQRSVVYMPRDSAAERLENIRRAGAEAEITPLLYDDTVRHAKAQAAAEGWQLVQDTAWEGYTEVPLLIMQGYLTIAAELHEQLAGRVPTHIFLQAGVGSMAAALAAALRDLLGTAPKIIVVEPNRADCFFRTAAAADGQLHAAEGELDTIMAGLACGEPSAPAWELLASCADAFVAMDDAAAARAMRILAAPAGADTRIISGESGAAGCGALFEILHDAKLRERFGIDAASLALCISTEGATDKQNYRRIVWDGAYGNE